MAQESPTRVVIAGGGFGGLYAALELERTLARDPDVEITLVNRDNFFLFTPMLHEVAASDLDLTHIVNPIRKLLRRVRFFNGDIERIDTAGRRVLVTHGADEHHHELPYDHLVLGLGSVTNFHKIPGLDEHALTMKTLGDAMFLRNRLIANLEEADFECAPRRDTLLTVVVAGGGFAGVETIAAVNDFMREAVRFYPNLDERAVRMVLVHSGAVILPELGEELGTYAQRKLAERGVEIVTHARVAGATEHAVTLDDGRSIPASMLVWTAGTSPNPLLASLPCALDHGRVVVNEFLEAPDHAGVWALGDCAVVPDVVNRGSCPPTAQHALRQGRTLARNIVASVRGGKKQPFRFGGLGQLAAIGKRTGVAKVFGFKFSGFFAWWLWRTVYLSKLPRFEKKVRVMLDWTLDLVFTKDLVQFVTFRAETVSHEHEGDELAAVTSFTETQKISSAQSSSASGSV